MSEKQKEQQNLKRLILDTTRSLLVTNGYASLSMRRIAREMDYSATSIYLHFKNKDALFHALIEEGMNVLLERQRKIAQQYSDNVLARLRALCEGYIAFGLEYPEYYEIMFMLHPELTSRFPKESFRRARRNLALMKITLDEGMKTGVVDIENSHASTNVMWASLHGAVSILLAQRLDKRLEPESFIQNVLDNIVRSVTTVQLSTA
ncbi:MAG: TetR/AcrR family transcriptional regulator [Rhodothermales bacterium]